MTRTIPTCCFTLMAAAAAVVGGHSDVHAHVLHTNHLHRHSADHHEVLHHDTVHQGISVEHLISHTMPSIALIDNLVLDHVDLLPGHAQGKVDTTHAGRDTQAAAATQDLRELTIRAVEWQWATNAPSVLAAMKLWFDDREAALATLVEGQSKNMNGGKHLATAARILPGFWQMVFHYDDGKKPDYPTLEKDLNWQFQNEWASLNSSRESWSARPRNEEWAYYNLLWGQRRNPEVLKNYRSCWNWDRGRVMDLVEKSWKQ